MKDFLIGLAILVAGAALILFMRHLREEVTPRPRHDENRHEHFQITLPNAIYFSPYANNK